MCLYPPPYITSLDFQTWVCITLQANIQPLCPHMILNIVGEMGSPCLTLHVAVNLSPKKNHLGEDFLVFLLHPNNNQYPGTYPIPI